MIEDRLEALITNYLNEFGEQLNLRKFLTVSKEKINLEKKLNRVNINSMHNKENSSKESRNV